MMTGLLHLLAGRHGWPVYVIAWPVYVIAWAAAFLESAAFFGLMVPDETVMLIAAGMLAAGGVVPLPGLLVGVIVAAVLGGSVGYWIGARFGQSLVTSRLGRKIPQRRWDQAQQYLQRRGAGAVVLGRQVGIQRPLVPVTAGIVKMPFSRFLAADILGGVTWSGVVVGVGYFAGASLAAAQHLLGTITVFALLGIAAIAVLMMVSDQAKKRCGDSSRPALQVTETVDADDRQTLALVASK